MRFYGKMQGRWRNWRRQRTFMLSEARNGATEGHNLRQLSPIFKEKWALRTTRTRGLRNEDRCILTRRLSISDSLLVVLVPSLIEHGGGWDARDALIGWMRSEFFCSSPDAWGKTLAAHFGRQANQS